MEIFDSCGKKERREVEGDYWLLFAQNTESKKASALTTAAKDDDHP